MGWIEENRITDQELAEICKQVEEAERSNLFDGLGVSRFQPKDREQFPTKEKLLQSISSDMKLYKSTFLKIYGYELTWTGFAEQALTDLERAGCSKAREYYHRFVDEYEKDHEAEMKRVAEWYRKQDFKQKGDEELRKRQQEVERKKEVLQKKSDRELLNLLQNMK